ncbi:MAG: hypothetical protein PHQ86_07795 [Dehalococcoidales bacterium]|nr:hypothetical protein [Dehalococcoidales bacterium]
MISRITKNPLRWGLSIDQAMQMKYGRTQSNCGKSEKELGITYTSIRTAVEEAVASFCD